MEIVGVALAIPPTVQICLEYGRELRAMCAALRNAEDEIKERVLRLDYGWLRWSHQLTSLQSIEHMMDDYHREVYDQTLEIFLGKLKTVTTQLRGLVIEQKQEPTLTRQGSTIKTTIANFEPKSVKYMLKKKSLDRAVEELEIWQRMSDHSWFLLLKMADPTIDAAIGSYGNSNSVATTIPSVLAIRSGLRDGGTPTGTAASPPGITFKPDDLVQLAISPIPFSTARLARRKDGNQAIYILNTIVCPHPTKYQLVKRDTRDLVRKLQHNEPQTFGLLNCKGFVSEQASANATKTSNGKTDQDDNGEPEITFTMIFRLPSRCSTSTSQPRSLRDLLITGPKPFSLSTRFEIARELAKSVSYVHSFGFVHKNIRPEAVLSFADPGSQSTMYCLVGFENFRREDGWTRRIGDDTLERNLYRHPSRQGSSPREDYIMQHDIYSLGVCLLEVGLWRSFIDYRPAPESALSRTIVPGANGEKGFSYDSHADIVPVPSPFLCLPEEVLQEDQITGNSDNPNTRMFSFLESKGKDHLLALARERLPGCMGSKYAEIVETCLTCLDRENSDFGDASEFEDEDGIRVGVRYIEKVLLRLNVLNV